MHVGSNRMNSVMGRLTPWTAGILVSCIGIFLVQILFQINGSYLFERVFGLSLTGIRDGMVWQLFTYMFLHGSAFHLFVNMLVLFFLGPELEYVLGGRRFPIVFFLSGILGGVGWLLISYPFEGVCIGASGAIFGLIGIFAALFPQRDVTLLVFFVLPVTMKAWVLAVGLGLLQLFMIISPDGGGVAYAAHLAGGIAGYVYGLTQTRGHEGVLRHAVSWVERKSRKRREQTENLNRAEVDRILDKIANEGIHTLTSRERDLLEKASRNRPS